MYLPGGFKMRKVHHKSLLLLVIWCLIGSLPRWGMVGSWIWLGVLILLAILFGSRKKEIPALFFNGVCTLHNRIQHIAIALW
jgi:hypothetical protein